MRLDPILGHPVNYAKITSYEDTSLQVLMSVYEMLPFLRFPPQVFLRSTPVYSKNFKLNETLSNNIKQNRQFVEPIRNIAEMNISRISNMKKSI